MLQNTTSTTGTGTPDFEKSWVTDHTKAIGRTPCRDNCEDYEDYDKDLRKRQKEHLDSIKSNWRQAWVKCMHDSCGECLGTGRKRDGSMCIHMISCPCPKCSPQCM
jgi:hypothetical protein